MLTLALSPCHIVTILPVLAGGALLELHVLTVDGYTVA